jgi:hypothetical protein
MGDEPGRLEDAKSEALAAFAAIAALLDLAGEPETAEHGAAVNALRGDAVRHLSAALELMSLGKGARG